MCNQIPIYVLGHVSCWSHSLSISPDAAPSLTDKCSNLKCQIPLILHHNCFLGSVDDSSLKLGFIYLKLACKATILASCVHFWSSEICLLLHTMQIAKHNITPALYQ